MVRDRMHDLPRKIQEFACINCGERFWLELSPVPTAELTPAAPAEARSAQVAPGVEYPWMIAQGQN
jgi:hypothetical protein